MKASGKRKISVKSIIISILLLAITGSMITGALIAPGRILNSQAYAREGIVTPVPTDYYSGPSEAIVKNASRQLTEGQCLSLIYGTWDSIVSPAQPSECNFSEYEIATTYDYNINSYYQKWYSWSATPYKAVDTTFKTYAAIFWRVTFTKYDGTDEKKFYITEGGTHLDPAAIDYDFDQQ